MSTDNDPIGSAVAADPNAGVPAQPEPVAEEADEAVDPVVKTVALGPVDDDGGDPLSKLAAATGIKDMAILGAIIEAATATMQASHNAEIAALRQELADFKVEAEREGKVSDLNESMGGYPWMYYRIGPTFADERRRGWITIGPGGASPKSGKRDTGSFALYLKKGFIPITNRGICPVPTHVEVWKNFVDFVKRGGAEDFPISQIVTYQWHKRNPFAKMGVRFPQVEAVIDRLTSWTCEYCGYSMDFMPGDPEAGAAYRYHLTNADKVTFKEAVEAVQRAGLTTTPFRSRSIEEITRMSSPNDA